ncbi:MULTISPECIES: hypothetical protein [unclassified Paraburkholderia]|uniref:hypothetical protein n=1 Tax=unclassified Paraburkholderia TaxID=2615204 RepID=UPI00197E29B0|nr:MULTISPECIES: hypothetical protein [unclassified Paraburkholderia]MBN3856980.1 hypothetical protein [Paraburkholderia sp. Ac-20340]
MRVTASLEVQGAQELEEAVEALSVYETELRAWMSQWFDHAVLQGLVRPPFLLDEVKARRLEGLFIAGLTPGEGAQAFFGVAH